MNDTSPPASAPAAWRVAVVGGGVTGLAAAHRLIELCRPEDVPLELQLLEAGGRLGGSVWTRRMGEYIVETGADSFITDKPWGLELCRQLGLEHNLIATDERYRRSLVLRKGKPVPVPDGFTLIAPARIWPVVASPLFSPLGKLRMAVEPLIPCRRDDDDESLADFVRRRLGQQALKRLVQPLVGGIYTSDPEKLSLQATLPRFRDMERHHGGLIRGARRAAAENTGFPDGQAAGARYRLFLSFIQGMSELVDALAQRVRAKATVQLECPVTGLTRRADGPGWKLQMGDRTTAEFDAVILAVGSGVASWLLSSDVPRLAESLAEIEYASTAVVATGHRLESIRRPLDAFGLVVPAIEKRKILAVSFASRKFPGRAPPGCVLLRTFVGGAMQPELLQRDDDELAELVRRELADVLGVSGREELLVVARHNDAMPQYHVGHLARIARIERQLAQCPGLALAGNAYHGVGIPDCILSGEQSAARIMAARMRKTTKA